MELIQDSCRLGGIFTFDQIRGVKGVLNQGRKVAILDEGGSEALIHEYVKMGGVQIDNWDARNRLVTQGLAQIINLLKGTGGTLLPTKIQLGSGSTGAGSWAKSLTQCRTPIASAGLSEATADTITIGTTTDTGDKLTFVKDFTASGAITANEAAVRSAAVAVCLCYAPFPSGDRVLANTDHLIVTYAFTLVP